MACGFGAAVREGSLVACRNLSARAAIQALFATVQDHGSALVAHRWHRRASQRERALGTARFTLSFAHLCLQARRKFEGRAHMKPAVESSSLCFFWDMQNCAVPSRGSPYECVTAIRAAVLKGEKTKEVSFNAYCDVATLSQETRQELGRSRVIVRDVPSQKPAAADIRLLQDLLHHTMTHHSGIIVLISGDIDFAETVHDLVHTGGYKVILIHNRQARPELCKNASSALSFEDIVIGKHTGKAAGGDKKPTKEGEKRAVKDADKTRAKDGDKKAAKGDKKAAKDANKMRAGDKAKTKVNGVQKKVSQQQQIAEQWVCVSCAKSFGSERARDSHVASTGHVVEWDCSACGKSFKSEVGLEQHKDATGHGQISCDECGKLFNNMKSLAQHLRSTGHCSDLSWRCPVCKDDWDELMDLLDHVRLDHESDE